MNPNLMDQSNKIERSVQLMDKVKSLIDIIESDLDGSDFKWTLFVASAANYKYDTLLKPFPSAYVANKIFDIEHLRETIACIPTFAVLLTKLRNYCDRTNSRDNSINDESINLLYWCLISVKEPVLKSINRINVSIVWFN